MASRTSITKEVTEDILMILLGIAVFVLPEGIPQTICLGGLIVVALYSCLEGVLRIIASADRMKSLKEEIRQLKTDLDQARKSADQVPESDHKLLELPELIPGKLRENAGIIQTVITSVYPDVPLVYKDYFRQVADLSRVDSLLVLLNEHSVKPFVDRLRQMEQPMSDEDYKQVLRELLQFSFLMLDFVDTYRFNVNNTPGQLLGLKVACGEISSAEADEAAKTATYMADETPRYIRVVKAVVDRLELGDDPFRYSGYKL